MKVLVADGMAKEAVKRLQAAGFEVDLRQGIDPGELLKIVPEYEALCVRSATKVTAEVIEAGTKLRVVGRAGVGLDNVDRVAAKSKGVKVFNTPLATSDSVAELAIGLMLAVSRFIADADATIKAGKWEKKRMTGVEIGGKRLGVIGTGPIGRGVMTRARALGMEVVATKRDLSTIPEELERLDVPVVPLDELLAQSDYISIHLPVNDGTRGLIDAAAIAKMKDGVFIINCARGGVVCEADLVAALKSGKVAGAGVDVYEKEPIESNPFAGIPRVVQTPHLGASTAEGQVRASTQLADQIIDELS